MIEWIISGQNRLGTNRAVFQSQIHTVIVLQFSQLDTVVLIPEKLWICIKSVRIVTWSWNLEHLLLKTPLKECNHAIWLRIANTYISTTAQVPLLIKYLCLEKQLSTTVTSFVNIKTKLATSPCSFTLSPSVPSSCIQLAISSLSCILKTIAAHAQKQTC